MTFSPERRVEHVFAIPGIPFRLGSTAETS